MGTLLQLAYAGSKGFACSTDILKILANYQTLIKNSSVTSGMFVDACIGAMEFHRYAITFVERGMGEKAIEMIGCTAELAGNMSQAAKTLVDEAEKLTNLATQALMSASKDETSSIENQKKMRDFIDKTKAREASLKRATTDLVAAVEEEKEREIRTAKEAKSMRNKAFAVQLLSTLMEPITSATAGFAAALGAGTRVAAGAISGQDDIMNNLTGALQNLTLERQNATAELERKTAELTIKKSQHAQEDNIAKKSQLSVEIATLEQQIQTLTRSQNQRSQQMRQIQESLDSQVRDLDEKEMKIAARRAEYQKELRLANAELAETISSLQSANIQKDELAKAVRSLEVTIKTLGAVKTVFDNTRVFWQKVQNHASKLTSLTMINAFQNPNQLNNLLKEIKKSGLSWLTLAHINRTAALSIEKVDKSVDNIMTNLPTGAEAKKLVEDLTDTMLKQIIDKIKKIEN